MTKNLPFEIRMLPVEDIALWKDNPRKNDGSAVKLAQLLKIHGVRTPVVVWEQDMTCYKGNTTLKACKIAGIKEVPVILARFKNKGDAISYALADNKASEWAEWDDRILKELLERKDLLKSNLKESIGFTEKDIYSIKNAEIFDTGDTHLGEIDARDFKIYPVEEIMNDSFDCFRRRGFPYPKMELFEMKYEINKLAALEMRALFHSFLGIEIADTFNPHRFEESATGKPSPFTSFNKDSSLMVALKKDMPQRYGKIGFLNLTRGTQAAANFRPAYARYLYETYGKKGGLALDPSFGYGGRLVGFLASNMGAYYGVDPSTASFKGCKGMAEALSGNKKVRLFHKCFEDFSIPEMKGSFDFVFTSPPYFNKESYSKEPTQSYIKFPEYGLWKEKFLKVLFQKAFFYLRKGSYCAINIADIKMSNKLTYPLLEDSKLLAKSVGFKYEKSDRFFLPTRNFLYKVEGQDELQKQSKEAFEEVLIFKK